MLLSEIKDLLQESLNQRRNLKWKQVDKDYFTNFSIEHRDYILELAYTNFVEFYGSSLPSYEIKFTGKDTDSEKESSYHGTQTNSTKHSLAVMGIIKNGSMEKLETLDWKMLFFTAKKNDKSYEQRVSLYNRMSSLIARENDLGIYKNDYSKFNLYILCKEDVKLSKELIDYVIKLVLQEN